MGFKSRLRLFHGSLCFDTIIGDSSTYEEYREK